MKWGEVDHTHHGKKAIVTVVPTEDRPARGEGPFEGTIKCQSELYLPFLTLDEYHSRSFVDWWDVEILDAVE